MTLSRNDPAAETMPARDDGEVASGRQALPASEVTWEIGRHGHTVVVWRRKAPWPEPRAEPGTARAAA